MITIGIKFYIIKILWLNLCLSEHIKYANYLKGVLKGSPSQSYIWTFDPY